MTTTVPTITSFTTYDISATLTPDPHHPGWYETEAILVVNVGPHRQRRRGLGFVSAEGVTRREYAGPELAGPYAYAFILPPSSDVGMGRLRVRGLVVDAALGDRLVFQGSTYVIEVDHNDNITLTPVG